MSKSMKPFSVGQPVSWKWMGGTVQGVIEEIHFETVVRILKGKTIKRKGSVANPAYLVKSQAGNLALKLHTELGLGSIKI